MVSLIAGLIIEGIVKWKGLRDHCIYLYVKSQWDRPDIGMEVDPAAQTLGDILGVGH